MYRRVAMETFVWEIRTGLNLAYYRTFAIPRIARLLVNSGETERRPLKRSMDTGLLMYELIDSGVDSERGRRVIRMLNQMHRRWPIAQEDYQYVLTTFMVVPTRFIDLYGWRPLTSEERQAAVVFYDTVGRSMGIRDRPDTYKEAAAYLDGYEAEHLRRSEEGLRLMAKTSDALDVLFPPPLRPAANLVNRLLLDDRMCDTFALRRPSPVARHVFGTLMRLRGVAIAHGYRPKNKHVFRSGHSGSAVYPNGYQLSDLGVDGPDPVRR